LDDLLKDDREDDLGFPDKILFLELFRLMQLILVQPLPSGHVQGVENEGERPVCNDRNCKGKQMVRKIVN